MGPAVLIVASLALTAFSAIQAQNQAVKAADAQADAASKQDARAQAELTRQQQEGNRQAAEAKSDRQRQAEKELAFLQVSGADAGSGSMTMAQRVSDLGFVEGQDLARLEANRAGRSDQLQSQKEGSREGVVNTITKGRNESQAATTGAYLQIAGGALKAGQQAGAFDSLSSGAGVKISKVGPYADGYKT